MTSATTECIRGCVVVVGEESDALELPATAARGALLCQACLGRIAWRLDDVPDIAARARLALVPGGAASGSSERVSGSREPDAPINVAAMEACDQLVAMLAGWVTYWARVLSLAPPRLLAGALAADRNVEGVRAGTTPETVADGLTEWGMWMKVHLPAIAAQNSVAAFHDELDSTCRKIARQFPRDEPREVQQRPRYCPICEVRGVRVTWEGRQPVVRCAVCDWIFETEWEELLHAIGIGTSST